MIINGVERNIAPLADLHGANLREANLREADLRQANLREANLRWANLREADLRQANLRQANLREANLRGVDLRGVDLYGADLYGADLYGADLRGADLRGVDLRGVDLWGCKDIRNTQIASIFVSGMSSRHDRLYFGLGDDWSLKLWAGCFHGSAQQLRDKVSLTHRSSTMAQLYQESISLAESCYRIWGHQDMISAMRRGLENGSG